jgi:hypothetical protein
MKIQKIKSGFFLVIGFLLSPLCWWNDLIFNLPIAYAFGKLVGLLNVNLFIPASIGGYWLSNLAGILLMQVGAVTFFEQSNQEQNLRKNILIGLGYSTAFTVIIIILWQNNLLDFALPS